MTLARSVVSVIVGCACLSTGARADAQATRTLELEDYYRIEIAEEPAISPDGSLVAFTRQLTDENENTRRREIWLAHADGSEAPRRLTNRAYDSEAPEFSPDGKLLVFSSRRENGSVWFLSTEEGGEAFQIPGVLAPPELSPDGKWAAFVHPTPPTSPRAETSSELETKIEERFSGRTYDWMQFRFDRRGYLPDPTDPYATPPHELYVVAMNGGAGGTPRRLTELGVDVTSFAWSPDNQRLIVTADAHQRDEYVYPRADLWLVPLDGAPKRLTDDGYHHTEPRFSRGGARIAYRRVQGLSMVIDARAHQGAPVDIYTMELATGTTRNHTADWDLRPGAPQFGPDGIYFDAGISGDRHLFRTNANGTVEQLTRGDRRLSAVSFSSDHRTIAFAGETALSPAELFVARLDGSSETRLSHLNDGWLETVALSSVERLSFQSKDGTTIEGWYVPPTKGTPEPHPVILSIHGGPHGAYGNRFMFDVQLWSAEGYGVVYTNPRGSTGYGEDFLYATWGGWGLKDSEDVLAGLDHVIERFPVDTGRLGVTGYSYGGFLTNWLLVHESRFAAAISGAGISNWVSDYATADIPRTKESEFYGPPWKEESGALLRRLSPITYVGRATTPTLFIHGESDFRVPVEQAEQMYVAFKKQKIPAKFIRYPDSYHGGWAPWDMVHRYYHGLKWWERYLGGHAQTTEP